MPRRPQETREFRSTSGNLATKVTNRLQPMLPVCNSDSGDEAAQKRASPHPPPVRLISRPWFHFGHSHCQSRLLAYEHHDCSCLVQHRT